MKLPRFDFYSSVITTLFVICAAALMAILMSSCAAPKDPISLYSPMWQCETGYNCQPPFNTNQLPE